jgi:hypothetical protein
VQDAMCGYLQYKRVFWSAQLFYKLAAAALSSIKRTRHKTVTALT